MKQLQEILGESNITMSGSMSDILDLTTITKKTYNQPRESTQVKSAFIDFKDIGIKYQVSDLKTYGFDSTCGTCNNHYSIKFVSGNSNNYYINSDSNGQHYFIEIGVDINISNGIDFTKYIYEIILSYSDFINHFQQYAYKDSIFYIYDYRGFLGGNFYTSSYVTISNIKAYYQGPDIYIGNSYNLDDIKVFVNYNNGEAEELNKTQFTVSTQMIINKGRNEIIIKYFNYSDKIYINGIYILTRINAEYIGDPIPLNTEPNRIDILVREYYNDTDIITIRDWSYKSSPIVTLKNNGIIVLEYNERTVSVKVPYINPIPVPISFEAHYHGKPIKVGERFNYADVHSRIILSDKQWIDLTNKDITISDNLVLNQGHENIYKATYTSSNGQIFTDYFSIFGYLETNPINPDFKIFLIHDNLLEEDVTEYYQNLFYDELMGKIYVTTNRLNKHLFKSKYRIILPKDTGLHKKYATEWIAIKDDFNVKITLIKVYDKEEF